MTRRPGSSTASVSDAALRSAAGTVESRSGSEHSQKALLLMDATSKSAGRDDTARWYKDAILYQTHIRAFADSNNDGIGDFKGLTSRLDYIQDLGVTTVWVLPFYP